MAFAFRQQVGSHINIKGTTIKERFIVPKDFTRQVTEANSFEAYLQQLPLKPHGTLVHLYNSEEKRNKVAEAAKGVPYDTAQKIRNCELYKWTLNARIEADNDFKQREADAEAKNQAFDKDNYMQFVVKAAKETVEGLCVV